MQTKKNLIIPLGEKLSDDIWSLNARFQEIIMYRGEDMNL
jgi:hypothetical protein